ncbi:MAG: TonB-dependent receptor [Chitinophagaceae bacterium]|nr:TonB-dependent receptor [Chitinophagaceae bacterium]
MKKILAVAALLMLMISTASAQNRGRLSGKVMTADGTLIRGATVAILNSNNATFSDSTGHFNIANLVPGKYVLWVSAVGYSGINKEVTIKANERLVIDVFLPASATNLESVIVTAQKLEENLQKIPVSITSLSSTQVKDFRLWQSRELTAIIPNMYSADPGDNRNVTSIRGITTTSYDPAVATYIDGVNQFGLDTYIPNLIDVERIEVLRGPQGSLYGRNAMGGVINILTKQPTNKTSGFIELNAGDYNQQRFSAGVRTPIIENKLFFGAALMYQRRNGFYTNEVYNEDYDRQKSITGNYYLRYLPATAWSINLNFKHHNNRNNGPFPLTFGTDNPFKLSQNATAKMIDNTLNGSLSINYSGSQFNFSSQTAYQANHRYYDAPLDGDFSPIDGITIFNDYGRDWNNVKAFTQEFKFTSPAQSTNAIKWTAGAYFFLQDNPVRLATQFGDDAAMVGAPDNNFSIINTNKAKSIGAAGYGQATISITPKFNVVAGLRLDYEKKDFSVMGEYEKAPDPAFVIVPDTSAEVDYTAISPRLALSYQATTNVHVYAGYSRGYRTGGLTQLSTDPSQPPLFPYNPEYSNNFELGFKSILPGNKVRINAAIFLSRVNDVQAPTLILPDAITVTRNAGKLESKGIEIELSATPFDNLTIDLTGGYTDAEFTRLKVPQNGNEVDLSGKKQVFTPEYTSMVAMQYATPFVVRHFRLIARVEWLQIGKQYFDLANTITQEEYSLLHTRIGLANEKIGVYFWGRNLADKRYLSYGYDFGAVHWGDPRNWGVTVGVNF